MVLGEACLVSGAGTVFSENIELFRIAKTFFYIPTVNQQNSGLPVRFRLSRFSPGLMCFENHDQDFPQKISYRFATLDSVVAEISGIDNDGLIRTETFPMHKTR